MGNNSPSKIAKRKKRELALQEREVYQRRVIENVLVSFNEVAEQLNGESLLDFAQISTKIAEMIAPFVDHYDNIFFRMADTARWDESEYVWRLCIAGTRFESDSEYNDRIRYYEEVKAAERRRALETEEVVKKAAQASEAAERAEYERLKKKYG